LVSISLHSIHIEPLQIGGRFDLLPGVRHIRKHNAQSAFLWHSLVNLPNRFEKLEFRLVRPSGCLHVSQHLHHQLRVSVGAARNCSTRPWSLLGNFM
jgi:hypothetical protein